MRNPGWRPPLPFLFLAVLAAATLVFPSGCDRPEPPPDDRPGGSGAIPPGGAAPPPGAPAELAQPLPVREEPAEGPTAAEPPLLPQQSVPPAKAATGNGEPGTAPPVSPDAVAPPAPIVDTSVRDALPVAGTADTPGGGPPARIEQNQIARKTARKPQPVAAAREAATREIPIWARGGEELSYRITFMGVTAGYARLLSKGRVRIGGRDAYHIQIKAWTTGTLSVLFPISEFFDYYLDAESLAPLRRDSVIRKVNRPEIVLFDQEKGTITHWYGDTMEVRKKKQIPPPGFYDGVGATYYFRSRGFGDRSVSIRVFGGRKVYRVSTERAGEEEIPYGNGKVDTFLVKPIYREEGGGGGKPMLGELLVWVSKDTRRVPVRLYASFRKGLEWRLVGELTSGLQ